MAEQHSPSNRDQTCVPCELHWLFQRDRLLTLFSASDDYNRVILHSPSESIYINASKVAVRLHAKCLLDGRMSAALSRTLSKRMVSF